MEIPHCSRACHPVQGTRGSAWLSTTNRTAEAKADASVASAGCQPSASLPCCHQETLRFSSLAGLMLVRFQVGRIPGGVLVVPPTLIRLPGGGSYRLRARLNRHNLTPSLRGNSSTKLQRRATTVKSPRERPYPFVCFRLPLHAPFDFAQDRRQLQLLSPSDMR